MHIASVNVRFYETDMMGIAHHSNHFRWFELARIEFLRKIGVTLWDMMNEDIVFPIMNVSCNYKEPANFDDELHIETYLVKMTRAQMVFRYRMRWWFPRLRPLLIVRSERMRSLSTPTIIWTRYGTRGLRVRARRLASSMGR